MELVRQKVKCLYLQGGNFEEPEESYNLYECIDFAETFFRLWPSDVDIIFSPDNVGDKIDYVTEQVIADIAWTDYHPIKQVYMTCDSDEGQKMWDQLTVINAVEGNSIFSLSGPGTVTITSEGITLFTASPTGNCRYQFTGDDSWNDAMLEKLRLVNKAH